MPKTKNIETKSLILHVFEPPNKIDGFEFIDLKRFTKVKPRSIKEIFIGDLLDYLTDDVAISVMKDIFVKLSEGGKLHIQSNDSNCLALAISLNHINSLIFKNMLFSGGKKNIFNLNEIKNMIQSIRGLVATKYRYINNIQYYVECVKNG